MIAQCTVQATIQLTADYSQLLCYKIQHYYNTMRQVFKASQKATHNMKKSQFYNDVRITVVQSMQQETQQENKEHVPQIPQQ